ncbi:Putative ribonuclease H protein At1g65750 [Linum perenne]
MFWKMAHNILATRQALRRRGIDLGVRCGICAGATETMEHIFFECSIAVDCWNRSGIRRWIESLPGFGTDCRQWVFEIVKSGATYLIQQAAAILWAIWRERNERVWQSTATTGESILRRCTEERLEWIAAQTGNATAQRPTPTADCPSWHPPSAGTVKCNTDIAFFATDSSFGVGRAVRNHTGHVLHYMMQRFRGGSEVAELELEALLDSIHWVKSMGYTHVTFEADNQSVVAAVNGSDTNISEFGRLVQLCKDVLAEEPYYRVCWIRRNRNVVAHELARRSRFIVSNISGEIPLEWCDQFVHSICFEMNH